MNASTRRQFLAQSGSLLALGAHRPRIRRDGPERQVRSRGQGRRGARSQPEPARAARHRHPLGRDRGGGARHPRGARAARAQRRRQAGDAGARRHPRPRLSLRLGDRHSGRRAPELPGHHDDGVGGRCRRQQFRRLPPLHRRRDAHPALCLRAHRQFRADAVSGAGALQHRFRGGRRLRQDGRRERRHRDRRQGADVGEHHRQQRLRAAQAVDPGGELRRAAARA